jgi:hypothetical protein
VVVRRLREGHAGAVNVVNKKCEGCQLKVPNFGVSAEGKARWCGGCAKGHAGAVDVVSKQCEGCGLKQPNFGLPAEGKKQPNFGLPAEGKRRWCSGCAKGHAGAVDVKHRKKC